MRKNKEHRTNKKYQTNKVEPEWLTGLKSLGFTLIMILVMMIPDVVNMYIIPGYKRIETHQNLKNQEVAVGDTLYFGKGSKWNNTWTVIAIDGTKILVVNDKCVDSRGLNGKADYELDENEVEASEAVTSETTENTQDTQQGVKNSHERGRYLADYVIYNSEDWNSRGLKEWLNGDYYTKAFTDSDKEFITDVGNGNIFLLSEDEVRKYSSTNGFGNRLNVKIGMTWWLRSTAEEPKKFEADDGSGYTIDGVYDEYSVYVDINGNLNGYQLNSKEKIGVRPAMWLEMGD